MKTLYGSVAIILNYPLHPELNLICMPEVVLILRNNKPHRHFWALPGGICEPMENYETTCIREVKEEIGLDIINLKRFKKVQDIATWQDGNNAADRYLSDSVYFTCIPMNLDFKLQKSEVLDAKTVSLALLPMDMDKIVPEHQDILLELRKQLWGGMC